MILYGLMDVFTVVSPGTIALYRFENNLLDSSTNGHDLSEVGTLSYATYSPDTRYPTYIGTFNSSNYATLPLSLLTALQGLTTWAIECYFYINADGSNDFIVSLNSGSFEFLRLSNNTIRNNNGVVLDGGSVTSSGGWYYICLTSDGVNRKIYVNGSLVASDTNGLTLPASITDGFVGIKSIGEGGALNGFIDRLRFSNVSRDGSVTVDPT